MSNSTFCIEQRKKQLQHSQKVLKIAIVGSVGIHALLALAVVELYEKTTFVDDPIELIIVDETSPVPKNFQPPVKTPPVPKIESMKISPPKSQPLTKTELSQSNEQEPEALIESSKPQEKTTSVSRVPESTSSNSLRIPELTSATLQSETAPPLSSKKVQTNTVSGNSQGTEQLKTGLENSLSAASINSNNQNTISEPTAPQIGTAPPLSSKKIETSTVSGNSQGTEQLKTGLENSLSAASINSNNQNTISEPTAPEIGTAPPLSSKKVQTSTVSGNSQGTEQLKTGLENSLSAASINSNNQNTISEPTAPQIGTAPPLSSKKIQTSTGSGNSQGIGQLREGLGNSSNAVSINSNSQNTTSEPGSPQIGTAPPLSSKKIQTSTGSGNSQGIGQLREGLGNNSNAPSVSGSGRNLEGNNNNPGVSNSTTVATRSAPPPANNPKPQGKKQGQGLRCLRECKPSYPSALNGAEGSAGVQLLISPNGDVINVTLVRPNNNTQINEQVILAAQKMKFSAPPNGGRASVPLTINFTVAGSEFDRRAREQREQQQRERQAREKERQARQAQLERERLERQRQSESERAERERQAKLEEERKRQQQQQQPKPQTQTQIEPPQPSTTEQPKEEQ